MSQRCSVAYTDFQLKTALESKSNIIPVQEKGFEWPSTEKLPADIQAVVGCTAVHWIHDYQQACIEKLQKYVHFPLATNKKESTLPFFFFTKMIRFFLQSNANMERGFEKQIEKRNSFERKKFEANDIFFTKKLTALTHKNFRALRIIIL